VKLVAGTRLFLSLASRFEDFFHGRDGVIAIHFCDEIERLTFRANGLAFAEIGAIAEARFVHSVNHREHAFVFFRLALRERVELRDF